MDDHPPAAGDTYRGGALAWTAPLLTLLGVLTLIGGVIAGVALMLHTEAVCTPNPFDASLVDCSGSRHPWTGIGAAVLVSGVVQALLLIVVGLIGAALNDVRADLAHEYENRLAAADDDWTPQQSRHRPRPASPTGGETLY